MTTPDKEEMPTDLTAGLGRLLVHEAWPHDIFGQGGCIASATHPDIAKAIVTACNAYEPMREALSKIANCGQSQEPDHWQFRVMARDTSNAALSTLPVNDRHHSGSDNERNFENVRDAWKIIWEREAEIARLSRSLSELEAHHVEQNRLKRRSEADSKTLRIIRAALYGTDRQTSDDVGRLRALLVALDALIEQCRPLIAVDAFVLRDAIYEAHQARAALKGVPQPASNEPDDLEPGKLRPCPFCGGEAERIDFDENDDEPENIGGSAITCKRCKCSTAVVFGYKETLFSSWNERAPANAQPASEAGKLSTDTDAAN